MSDSGRQIGDCSHGHTPEWCVTCLRDKVSRLQAATEAAVAAERAACVGVIRQYLLYDSQRAVSWHEVQDVLAVIRRRDLSPPPA